LRGQLIVIGVDINLVAFEHVAEGPVELGSAVDEVPRVVSRRSVLESDDVHFLLEQPIENAATDAVLVDDDFSPLREMGLGVDLLARMYV
jgi:hypothetical protein